MDVYLAIKSEFQELGYELSAVRMELKFRRLLRALKAGFDPNQPRDVQGRWSDESGQLNVAARGNSAECDLQYQQDTFICNAVRTRLGWAQAAERYAACLAGRPIPQLRF